MPIFYYLKLFYQLIISIFLILGIDIINIGVRSTHFTKVKCVDLTPMIY